MNGPDINEVRLAGTIDRLKAIATKTGNPMAEILLKVRQDSFRVTAFGNLAERILAGAHQGQRLSVSGTLTASSWKDESTGDWRNSFSITAWGIELATGEKISFQRADRREHSSPAGQGEALDFTSRPDDPF